MAFEWLIKLNNMVSDPAEKAANSLKLLKQELKGLQAQQKEMAAGRVDSLEPLRQKLNSLQVQQRQLTAKSHDILGPLRADIALGQARVMKAPNEKIRDIFLKDLKVLRIKYKEEQGNLIREQSQLGAKLSRSQAKMIKEQSNQAGKASGTSSALARSQADLLRHQLRYGDATRKSGGAVSSLADSMRDARRWARDWLLILDPLVRLIRFVGSEAMAMGQKIASAVQVREESMIGMKNAFGDNAEGMFRDIEKLALRTGRNINTLMKEAMEFGNLKVPQDLIKPILEALSDAQVMGLHADKLKTAFEESFSGDPGKLREIRYQLDGVINKTLFWKHLAKDIFNDDSPQAIGNVNKLVEQNRIAGQTIALAMMQTLQEMMSGGLGKVSFERADKTLVGILDRFEQRMTSILMGIADTPGFKVFKDALNNILSVISNEKFAKAVQGMASDIGEMFKPLTGKEGKDRIESFFERLRALIEGTLPWVFKLGGAIDSLMKRFVPTLAEKKKALEDSLKFNPGQQYFLGNKGRVSPEEFFGLPGGEDLTKKLIERQNQDEAISSAINQGAGLASRQGRGFVGAETPVMGAKIIHLTVPVHVEVHGNTSKEDADSIGKTTQEHVTKGIADTLQNLNTEQ